MMRVPLGGCDANKARNDCTRQRCKYITEILTWFLRELRKQVAKILGQVYFFREIEFIGLMWIYRGSTKKYNHKVHKIF